MWHQWFNLNFTKLREYFLCARKTKIMTLFNNSSPPRHPGAILGSITYVNNVCTHIRCLRSDQSVNNVSTYGAADTEQHTLFTYAILSKMAPEWRGGEKLLKIKVEPLMSQGLFCCLWEGQRALGIHSRDIKKTDINTYPHLQYISTTPVWCCY